MGNIKRVNLSDYHSKCNATRHGWLLQQNRPTLRSIANLTEIHINASLHKDTCRTNIQLAISETPAVIEEVAILFANSQSDIAELLLQQAIQEDDLGAVTKIVWSILL